MTEVSKFAHLATNNQFSTNNIFITTSANKKWDRLSNDIESWEVRFPCGTSGPTGCNNPAAEDMLGRCSAPPIHQSPWWLDGSWLRAVGLSPYVGWLSNTVPVFFQSSIPFSKSNLQGTQDKENRAERFVFISNSAPKNSDMDISMPPIFQ